MPPYITVTETAPATTRLLRDEHLLNRHGDHDKGGRICIVIAHGADGKHSVRNYRNACDDHGFQHRRTTHAGR
ncbi:MAG: hypothetical protein ACLUOF_10335 [Ruminococcus sp.]